jgi:hypothetical protein
VTISPFNSLLRRRVNDVKASERYLAGHSKVVDPHPVEEFEFWEQVKESLISW